MGNAALPEARGITKRVRVSRPKLFFIRYSLFFFPEPENRTRTLDTVDAALPEARGITNSEQSDP